jgi:hypothetical protein
MAFKSTPCPITRQEFLEHAKELPVQLGGVTTEMAAEVKEFSTRSLGWYLNGKTELTVNDKKVKCQIGLNVTIVNSKELP